MSVDQLREAVSTMERVLAGDETGAQLLRVYHEVAANAFADLDEERDRLLSRAAALMLIEQLVAVSRSGAAES